MLSALCVRLALRHVVYFEPGPSSMKDYCLNEVHDDRYTFRCPKCEQIWEYFLVRHVAGLDDKTRSYIEKRVVENYIQHGRGHQQCPGCYTWCTPFKNGDIRLRCPICSQSKGEPYDFCWACLRKWRSTGLFSFRRCGNEGCHGKDPRLKILVNAPKEQLDDIPGCPSIRACAKCGLLIIWSGGCRHMTCTSCENQFCFICLKPWKTHKKDTCSVAPIQQVLLEEYEHVRPKVMTVPPDDGRCIIL